MQNVISDFADYCGLRDLDPRATLEILNAQDWSPGDSTPITDDQLEAINRLLKEIPGEPTLQQVEATFRAVMSPSS